MNSMNKYSVVYHLTLFYTFHTKLSTLQCLPPANINKFSSFIAVNVVAHFPYF